MYSGDAAEQVVRLSLEGVEVAARISGAAAKNIAILLVAILKEEHKTQGKARLKNMIKSGKELKVFSIQNKDLKKFSQEAKRYGVLYCVLKDKEAQGDQVPVDIIARAEDASKIQRIMERFELASVDMGTVYGEVAKDRNQNELGAIDTKENDAVEKIINEVVVSDEKEAEKDINPHVAKTEKNPPSEQHLNDKGRVEGTTKEKAERPSVREKLREYSEKLGREDTPAEKEPKKEKANKKQKNNTKRKTHKPKAKHAKKKEGR